MQLTSCAAVMMMTLLTTSRKRWQIMWWGWLLSCFFLKVDKTWWVKVKRGNKLLASVLTKIILYPLLICTHTIIQTQPLLHQKNKIKHTIKSLRATFLSFICRFNTFVLPIDLLAILSLPLSSLVYWLQFICIGFPSYKQL